MPSTARANRTNGNFAPPTQAQLLQLRQMQREILETAVGPNSLYHAQQILPNSSLVEALQVTPHKDCDSDLNSVFPKLCTALIRSRKAASLPCNVAPVVERLDEKLSAWRARRAALGGDPDEELLALLPEGKHMGKLLRELARVSNDAVSEVLLHHAGKTASIEENDGKGKGRGRTSSLSAEELMANLRVIMHCVGTIVKLMDADVLGGKSGVFRFRGSAALDGFVRLRSSLKALCNALIHHDEFGVPVAAATNVGGVAGSYRAPVADDLAALAWRASVVNGGLEEIIRSLYVI